MIGPCGLGPILLEVGVAGTLKQEKNGTVTFLVHIAALLAILEKNPHVAANPGVMG